MTTLIEPKASVLEGAALSTLLQPRPDELWFGPVPFPANVQGVALSLPVTVALAIEPAGDQLQIHARLLGDLSDLQHKIGSLIDTIPLPTDGCAQVNANNLTVRIWGKELTITGDTASLILHGDVIDWFCLQLPFSDPDPKRIVTQPFDATLPFQVVKAGLQTIAVQLGEPTVTLGGQFGSVTQGILNIAGVNINAQAGALLNRSIPSGLLQQTLPADLEPLHPEITLAGLRSDAGSLALYAELNASIDGKVIGQLIRTLLGF
jgi:hypothetical protein